MEMEVESLHQDENLSKKGVLSYLSLGHVKFASNWRTLLFGQALSLALAVGGSCSATLFIDCEISVPMFQNSLMYSMLIVYLVKISIRQYTDKKRAIIDVDNSFHGNDKEGGDGRDVRFAGTNRLPFTPLKLRGQWWYYFILSFLDVQANFFTFLSFRFTSFSNITAIGSLAIPAAMVSSRFIFSRKYRMLHLLGACVCLVGVSLDIFNDEEHASNDQDYIGQSGVQDLSGSNLDTPPTFPRAVHGDMYAVIGALLYGLNDVLAESVIMRHGNTEFLGMLGLFGAIIGFTQTIIIERNQLRTFDETVQCTNDKKWALVMIYSIIMVFQYVGRGKFLLFSEAALLNLSLLTSNLWSVLFVIFDEKIVPNSTFFVALFMILSGVFIYESVPSPIENDGKILNDDEHKEKIIEFPASFQRSIS